MKKMLSFVILFFFVFLAGCNDLPLKKGKKGDFTFRKCTNCKIND
mgnify:FL=1|tara:strand:+ start:291 stop:425 length:135 start_codon:yes stop_codon:yes gene_type:complete